MRWRLGVSVLTLLTTTIAVAAAVLGPLYLHTASDSVLRRTVADAPLDSSDHRGVRHLGPRPAPHRARLGPC